MQKQGSQVREEVEVETLVVILHTKHALAIQEFELGEGLTVCKGTHNIIVRQYICFPANKSTTCQEPQQRPSEATNIPKLLQLG
jgi:hypothetical protein